MEADLSRFYNIDYRDRWRFDADGRRKLTLRMIRIRLERLPHDSALLTELRDGREHWGTNEVLLAHIWQHVARSDTPHPMLTAAISASKRPDPDREKRLQAARNRAAERRRAIAAGEIT